MAGFFDNLYGQQSAPQTYLNPAGIARFKSTPSYGMPEPQMSSAPSGFLTQDYVNPDALASPVKDVVAPKGILDSFWRQKDPTTGLEYGGYGQFGWDVLKGATNAYLGMQQLDMAKKNLAFNEQSFWTNYNAQKQLTNSRLEDRQRARVASNPDFYQSVSDYMNKNGVK